MSSPLRPYLAAAALVLSTSSALAAPAHLVLDRRVDPDAVPTGAVCGGGPNRCHVHVHATAAGDVVSYSTPVGFGPADLQAAYGIAPAAAVPATVAIVDAYGYRNLETDLATYRAHYGLPPCTIANGCLSIVNQNGQTSPLPGPPPSTDDWTIETALDVDMVSAACPSCSIVVVLTQDSGDSMYSAQATAAARGTVVSNSWGLAQQPGQDLSMYEPYFDHPGVATFVSSGDNGYDEGGSGPHYPSTSAYAIAVGGTHLQRASNTRGWSETAWTSAGSSCSLSIGKPAYQQTWPCAYKATTDLSAVADPQTGVAVYNAANGGWMDVGGTSAAAPFVAAIFAATGHGAATGAYVASIANTLNDVTSGSNGACGTALCNAGFGWDGPTGFGTPNARALPDAGGNMTLDIASPAPGDTVAPGFEVQVDSTGAYLVELRIDGTLIDSKAVGPYTFATPPMLAAGDHEIEVHAYGSGEQLDSFTVTLAPPGNGAGSGMGSGTGPGAGSSSAGGTSAPGETIGGCSASGGGAGSAGCWLLVVAAMVRGRRRRVVSA